MNKNKHKRSETIILNYMLSVLVLLPIIAGILIYILPLKRNLFLSVIIQIVHFVISFYCLLASRCNPILFSVGSWIPPVGISIYADSIAMSFVTLASFLFLMFVIYNSSRHYVNKMFYLLFLSLQGLLTGIFLLDDLFTLFVLIEVSTIIVSLLIMHKRDSRSIYDGLIYLLVNIFAMAFFLLGISILYKIVGTFSIRLIKEIAPHIVDKRSLYLPFALIITAVSLKSALMPLFSWLPKAHGTPSAPSVVSAVLSGLYVKGGVYLFLRVSNAFVGIDVSTFFLVCGIITSLVGFILAFVQTDIKLLLSYSTVSQLGLIMIAFNLGGDYTMYGGVYHILSHALFKSALFLCAGIIIEKFKSRNINDIRGVFKTLPIVSFVCIFAILAITGAPLFNGSISKYLIGKSNESVFMDWIFNIINLGTLIYFIKFAAIFLGKKQDNIDAIPFNRQIVLIVLGTLCLLGGIFGEYVIEFLYDIHFDISLQKYIEKSLIFLASLLIAVAVNKIKLPSFTLAQKIRDYDATFNTIAMTIPLFFTSILAYLFLA